MDLWLCVETSAARLRARVGSELGGFSGEREDLHEGSPRASSERGAGDRPPGSPAGFPRATLTCCRLAHVSKLPSLSQDVTLPGHSAGVRPGAGLGVGDPNPTLTPRP